MNLVPAGSFECPSYCLHVTSAWNVALKSQLPSAKISIFLLKLYLYGLSREPYLGFL